MRMQDANVGDRFLINMDGKALDVPQERYALLSHYMPRLVSIAKQRVVLSLRNDAFRLNDLPLTSLLYRCPSIDGTKHFPFLVGGTALPNETILLTNAF